MPHGMCYEWDPKVIWLHVLSDGFIALAYYSIPLTLIYFVRKRTDVAFDWIFICFAVFIIACGTTHVMEIVNIWQPIYWLSGFIKAITAITSVITAILLVRLIPTALAIPSPQEMRKSNKALKQEILDRTQASQRVEELNRQLVLQTAQVEASHKELESFFSLEQELRKKAEAAERAKGEFLAIMSHEIRTPMNGVIGMTSILAETELTPMQSDYLSIIQSSGESLLEVINDILDFSKVESGQIILEKRQFNLRRCIEEALDLFAVQIRTKGLEGIYLIASQVPPYLNGDAMRLRQVLVNLLGNALKFTAKGEIVLEVKLEKIEADDCHLLFSIKDTGIGIPPEGITKLFRAFQQVDTSTTRKYGGTGLGLAICKNLVELMGGTIWIESQVGLGSTFFFTGVFNLPPTNELPHDELPTALHSSGPLSVLVVDDNETNRRFLEIQLESWGMKPVLASSGAEALALLEKGTFDLALLDLQMPAMDGVMLAQKIRLQSPLPLFLLSSSGEVLEGEEARLFQAQISKPIKHSLLLDSILKLTGTGERNIANPTEKVFDRELAKNNPHRILLVEDNLVNQKVGLKMLSQFGYSADLASNGKEAVERAGETLYDLILMDIQMPEMDGIEASALIRQQAKGIPRIIALTAEALKGDRERFLALGFDSYLSKPLQAKKLREVLMLSENK